MQDDPPLLCIVGPTAAGKSALALAVAGRLRAEIVSLDSMQVYRGMDVGTAKPTRAEREQVPHHMLDRVDPDESYDVHRWLADVEELLGDLRTRGVRALFVGGTGFYLQSLLAGIFAGPEVDRDLRARIEARVAEQGGVAVHRELAGVDPLSAGRIHPNDTKRLVRALEVWEQTGRAISDWQREWGWHGGPEPARERAHRIVGLAHPTQERDRRIAARTRAMLAAGWAEEAAGIRARGGFSATSIQALGYREVLDLADGRLSSEACAVAIAQKTRQFARRQQTWYRKFASIRWLAAEASARAHGDEGADGVPATVVEEAIRALEQRV